LPMNNKATCTLSDLSGIDDSDRDQSIAQFISHCASRHLPLRHAAEPLRDRGGHFHFAQTEHYHFAPTYGLARG
jgi:hypothetical protein